MEAYQDFVIISLLSLLLAFLIGKIFALGEDNDKNNTDSSITTTLIKSRNDSLNAEMKFEEDKRSVDPTKEIIDKCKNDPECEDRGENKEWEGLDDFEMEKRFQVILAHIGSEGGVSALSN